ncbi:hypothetical protein HPB47_025539 [Ixodes persulcatus]|uniref:Uncharacterized protein n=1 Tax=Ixodes persulcatus TaxID=34615 RepID=A0AC60Q175_IXOPE|nr:hypothetical protein HPB47_025539 [Ixodes persulcatus]
MHKTTLSSILRETLPAIWETLAPLFLKPPTAANMERYEDMIKAAVCLHNVLMEDEAYCPPGYMDGERRGQRVDGAWRADITAVGANRVSGPNSSSPTALGIRDLLADYFVSPRGSISWQDRVVDRA